METIISAATATLFAANVSAYEIYHPTFRIASHRVTDKVLHKEAPAAPPPVGAGY
jgi:hypothetical protein